MSESNAGSLKALGTAIAAKRDEAVLARKNSGIEEVWSKCEEAYLGIDDANRHEFGKTAWAKPTSMTGGLTSERGVNDETKSTVFVRLTARYVDAGAAKLGEILLPVDQKPFSFGPSPVPDLVKHEDDNRPLTLPNGAPLVKAATPEQAAQTGAQQVPVTPSDIYKDTLERAKKAATKAETRIYDWMVECNYAGENRKVIFDSSRLGAGVLKAPIPTIQMNKSLSRNKNVVELEIQKKIVPGAKWVDVWNFFPDPTCGEDIHSGDFTFERDYLSPKSLRALIGQDGYLESQIEKVLLEGPDGHRSDEGAKKNNKDGRFEVWYFYGQVKAEELREAYTIGNLPEDKDLFYCVITLVNNSVIRAILNPLDSGVFPYHVMNWSRRAGHWAGVGVAEQCDMPQRTVNAATRALLNNSGYSGGVQLLIDQASIQPANGKWTITPNKIWYKTGDAPAGDIRDLMTAITFPNITPQLMDVINYGFKLAEESTSIPLITQGQTGPTTPETLGAVQLQNNNAATLLRNIGYHYDDRITEPVVNALYEWLLLDPDVPDEEKGDFKINARGSAAMVERAIQEITLSTMGQLVLNPAFGVDPKKWFADWMLSKRLDPTRMQYTEEELKQMQSQPPQPPIQVQVAQVKAQADMQKLDKQAQIDMQMHQLELDRIQQESAQEQNMLQTGGATPHQAQATARIEQERIRAETQKALQESRAQAELARAEKEREIAEQNGMLRIRELELKRELALLEYSQEHKLTLEQVKADLAKTAMIEQTKRELAAAERSLAIEQSDKDRVLDLHKHKTSLVRDEMSTPNTP